MDLFYLILLYYIRNWTCEFVPFRSIVSYRVALVITRLGWFEGLFTGESTARIAVHQHKVNQVLIWLGPEDFYSWFVFIACFSFLLILICRIWLCLNSGLFLQTKVHKRYILLLVDTSTFGFWILYYFTWFINLY